MTLKGFKNKHIIVILLLVNVSLVYLLLYFDVISVSKCAEYLERPHTRHKLRVRPAQLSFNMKNLSENDYSKLIDIKNFSFIILNEHACDSADVFLLILVPSAPGHAEHRLNIRGTWGFPKKGIKLVFFLGMVIDQQLQEEIEMESKLYGDIIQGNFIDSYHNLTYKTVMSLKYVVYHCPKVLYILKIDDDSFVNTPLLLNFLKNDLSPNGAANLFLCNDMTGSPVIRDNQSKWYVPEDVYPDNSYPSYCSGWYAIFSPDVCFKLYQQSQNLSIYLFVEDAFVYGIAGGKANLKHIDISKYTLASKNPNLLFDGKYDKIRFLFGSPNMNIKLVKRFWEYFRGKPVPLTLGDSVV
ncbi:beta-1,3-galactosyltransferase 1-like isoform X3 [Rhynchophorus ferrugineus]|uniref:beta-1,3-galactosyltransferase 1-like isoform X3 n=1 Tax=Rhynchophorus ferrugineus TaxID=354439 RepID=UPI003FCC2970